MCYRSRKKVCKNNISEKSRGCRSHRQTSTWLQWWTGTRQQNPSWEVCMGFPHSHGTTALPHCHHENQARSCDP